MGAGSDHLVLEFGADVLDEVLDAQFVGLSVLVGEGEVGVAEGVVEDAHELLAVLG